MKKALLVFIAVACASLVQAQSIDVSFNVGVLSRHNFTFNPLVLSGNVSFAIPVVSFITVSPEFTMYTDSKFKTDSLILAPGGTINFSSGQLFFGAGIVKEFWLKSSDVSIPLEMKLQAGILASKFRLGAYMLTFWKDMFNELSFGFTIGFAL
jgi:hypothetical protein